MRSAHWTGEGLRRRLGSKVRHSVGGVTGNWGPPSSTQPLRRERRFFTLFSLTHRGGEEQRTNCYCLAQHVRTAATARARGRRSFRTSAADTAEKKRNSPHFSKTHGNAYTHTRFPKPTQASYQTYYSPSDLACTVPLISIQISPAEARLAYRYRVPTLPTLCRLEWQRPRYFYHHKNTRAGHYFFHIRPQTGP